MNKTPSCLLKLLSDPSLSGVTPALLTPGTQLSGGEILRGFRLEPRFFPCCDGKGVSVDSVANKTTFCGLPQRIKAVRDLLRRYQSIWGDSKLPMPTELSPVLLRQVLSRLKAHVDGAEMKGFFWRCSSNAGGPSLLWAVALCAAWRFGLQVHLVNFTRLLEPSYLPKVAPALILVEQVDKLWEPRFSEELEGLVSFAYRSKSPFWLELASAAPLESVAKAPTANPQSPQRTESPLRTRNAFSRKIATMKERTPLGWLSASGRSKLRSLLEDLQPEDVGEKSPRTNSKRSKDPKEFGSGVPKLPWDS
jgi:hypothetical protein